jgi:mannose-6-phosphate isomerase-like protein (cupin superfamily)
MERLGHAEATQTESYLIWCVSHRHIYTKTSAETNGEYLLFRERVSPGNPGAIPGKSASPPIHIHPRQSECFEVVTGTMGFYLDGEEGTAQPHDTDSNPICIPAGIPHTFWNAANETELELSVTVQPALRSEEFFRTLIGFLTDYKTLANMNPLQLVVTFVHGDVQPSFVPAAAWKVIKHVIAPVAEHGLGFKPFYDEYTHLG